VIGDAQISWTLQYSFNGSTGLTGNPDVIAALQQSTGSRLDMIELRVNLEHQNSLLAVKIQPIHSTCLCDGQRTAENVRDQYKMCGATVQ
jgi:hypothetical protein